MQINKYNIQLGVFLSLTIFILIEGFFYYYSYKLSYLCLDNFLFDAACKNDFFDRNLTGFNPLIWNENRLVEVLQVLLLFFTLYYLIKILKILKNIKSESLLYYFILIYFIAILYFFLEEISWGQHIFKWQSNTFFLKFNNQGETNIHNISNLFDQLPRAILTIWCGLSFIIFKIASKLNLKNIYFKFVLPMKELKYISIILLIFFIPDFIVDKLNLHPGYENYTTNINTAEIFDFITFNFIRLSEFQELIFSFYLFNHSANFHKYIIKI